MTKRNSILLAMLLLFNPVAAWADTPQRTFKVLCIGSSFGVNSTQHLYQLAADCGATDIVVANLFRTACTIDVHWQQASGNLPGYEYKKNSTGTWTSKANQTMLHGIKDEAWDYIIVMQSAEKAADASSYTDNITNLVNYVNANKTNPNAKIGWNAVWSFTGTIATNYYSDQATMYYFIVNAVKERVLTNPLIDFVIPSGTAIQNARSSFIGDNFNADAMHLNGLGSYVVGMAWIKQIKGWAIDDITWSPGTAYSAETIAAAKDAVNSAVATPRRITLSSFPPLPVPVPPPAPVMPPPGPDGKIVIPLLTDNFDHYAGIADMKGAGWQMNETGGTPAITTSASPQNLQSVSIPAGSAVYRTFNPVAVNDLPGRTSPGKNARLVISFDGYLGSASGASQSYFKVRDAATGYSAVSIGRRGAGSIRYSDSIESGSTDLVVAASLPKFTKVKMEIKLTDSAGAFSDVAYTKVNLYVSDMNTPIASGTSVNMIAPYTKSVDRFYVGGASPTALDNLDVRLVVDAELSSMQSWRLEHFNTIHPAGTAADGEDPDGDGANNLHEFLAGTRPRDASSVLRIVGLNPEGDHMRLTFSSVIGKRYRVEQSGTLSAGSWQTVRDAIAGVGGSLPVTVAGGAVGSTNFYRVAVVDP